MKKILLFLLISMAISTAASAQMLCGFDAKMDELKRENPKFLQQLEQTEQYIRKFIANNPQSARKPMTTYTIPVVVHVLHTGGAIGSRYNPTDAQIEATIDYINQVYAGTYPGMQEPVEGGGVVNMELRFELAKRSPSCGFTNGIERVDASSIPNYAANGVNRANSNGVTDLQVKNFSRWNAADYYNIWVVNKIDGKDGTSGQFVAGYAYFAGAPANIDGTVMLATQMKSGAKTLPHELGHAFNLYHTFEGSALSTTCPTNTDCNTQGDRVCDTDPVSENVNSSGVNDFSCRTDVNSCTSLNYTRNTESNFMSYTNCHTLFTNGQKARVQAAMTLPGRASLIASQGTIPCGTVINFNTPSAVISEENMGNTTGCRTYQDYTYLLNIGSPASESATVKLLYSGTATKGLDYEVTTNGDFDNPVDEMTFTAGSATPRQFTIRVYDDATVEAPETVIVNFGLNTSGNATKGTLNPIFTLTINDNDVAPVAANTNSYQVGNMVNGISNVFDAANAKQRGQFQYKASELLAAGITKGPIASMQLLINSKATTGNFNNFTIRLGSGASPYLYDGSATLGINFTTVYNNAAFSTTAGWNTFTFSTPYVWDGKSNLVVDYCYSATTGTGADQIVMYPDGGTPTQYNFIFSNNIDCATGYTTFSAFGNGLKPSAKFGLDHPATEVETATSGMKTEHLTIGSDDYFYSNSHKIMAKIGNLDAEPGCVKVAVENAGTTWPAFLTGQRSAKVFSVTPTTNGSTTSYTISLYLTPEELGGKDPATLKIAKTSAAIIGDANLENTVYKVPVLTTVGTNSVFTATFTGFSRFFLVDELVALPVTLVSFTGKLNDQSETDLSWKVSQQHNLKGFDVEHSIDGQIFTTIHFTPAMGGTTTNYDYNYKHKTVAGGCNYYRLKMIDFDGHFSHSQVIKVENNNSGRFVTLTSNPVKETIGISVNNHNLRSISAVLYNAVGAKVAAWQLGNRTGNIQLPVDMHQLAPGVYLLKVSDGNQIETLKVLKK